MLEVIVSPITGFCFGVKRAMRLIEEGIGDGGRTIYSIGDVIHNSQAVEDLRSRGVLPVASMDELSRGDTLIIEIGNKKDKIMLRVNLNLIPRFHEKKQEYLL